MDAPRVRQSDNLEVRRRKVRMNARHVRRPPTLTASDNTDADTVDGAD